MKAPTLYKCTQCARPTYPHNVTRTSDGIPFCASCWRTAADVLKGNQFTGKQALETHAMLINRDSLLDSVMRTVYWNTKHYASPYKALKAFMDFEESEAVNSFECARNCLTIEDWARVSQIVLTAFEQPPNKVWGFGKKQNHLRTNLVKLYTKEHRAFT